MVLFIPKQLHIAFVGSFVVCHCGRCGAACGQAFNAQWVGPQPCLAVALPAIPIQWLPRSTGAAFFRPYVVGAVIFSLGHGQGWHEFFLSLTILSSRRCNTVTVGLPSLAATH